MAIIKPFRVIVFLLLLFFFITPARTQSYLLSSLPAEEELSSRQITCIFQDSKGFIWIGTEDGLNFYNANSIKIFKHDVKNNHSLLNNYIQTICEDQSGNIWIGTANGVDRYSAATNSFQHFTEDDQKKSFGFKCQVYTDRKGNIWIGCDGLFRLDTKLQQFKKIVNPYSDNLFGSRLSNIISGFYQDSEGRYWVSTNDGLFLYDDDKNIFARFDTAPMDDNYKRFGIFFGSVYEDKNGGLWVGTWGYGVFKISVTEKKLLPIGEKGIVLTYTSQELNGQQLFWCANQGLISIDRQNKIQSHLVHHADDPFSFRDDAVSYLFTDRQGQLWIGYEKQGIQVMSPGNQLIKTYTISTKEDKDRISSVGVILKRNNSIYLGGWYSDALCRLDNSFKIEKWWKYLPPDQINGSSDVGDVYVDGHDNIWLATAYGLVCMNEKKDALNTYRHDSSVSKRSFFLKILPEGDSVLWLAGYNNGLSRFSVATHHFELYGNDRLPLLWKILFDKKGNIWCADNIGQLRRFNTIKKDFTIFKFDSLTEKSIYYDLAYDSTGNILWVAGTSGLLKVNLENFNAQLFLENDGLPTNHINLLAWDRHHRLWIATDKGLSLYNQQKNSFRNFYINNGLSTEQLDHSMSVGPDGKLYIGAENSFMIMDIDAIGNDEKISPVYITAVYENGNRLQPALKDKQEVIDLPAYRNNLSFEFAIADFINSEDNQLLYQLDGWDKDFIRTKKGAISYNKLPPGEYVLRVKGINHNGVKNDTGDTVKIIIHPPFWKTTWFLALFSIALITVFALVVRYVSQRNLKEKLLRLEKEQAVEKERNRISRDMHDDLGSGLTKIAIMSEVVKKQIHEPEKAKQQLENISESSRELIDNLQDIIWVLNPKNDTLENLAAYIREYVLKFFEPFGTDIRFDYPEKFPEIKLSEEARRNIFLTVKESFNNISKHAWCNKINVGIQYNSSAIVLTIKDDGKGFDISKVRQFGNGLMNMQNRIEQIGGRYEIHSEPGKGTKTVITIPS